MDLTRLKDLLAKVIAELVTHHFRKKLTHALD
jgi:hypothetical protein